MEKELNIAAILKDKPKARLYDELHNIKVELDKVSTINCVTTIWCKRELPNKVQHFGYSERGTERGWLDGLQILKPSKEMRDWEKFAWKKGDVLKSIVGNNCIFDCWANEDYTEFYAEFLTTKGDERYAKHVPRYTIQWYKEDNRQYIHEIEKHYGGKLNLSTLEIENQEFKDGDIVFVEGTENYCDYIEIFSHFEDGDICDHASYDIEKSKLDCDGYYNIGKDEYQNIRLATDTEKQQLFSALEKEGKRWNSETKTLEDLPKKCEFKAFDKVLVRNYNDEVWRANIFSHIIEDADFPYTCIEDYYRFCIPYNEETKHLLGTTDDYEE